MSKPAVITPARALLILAALSGALIIPLVLGPSGWLLVVVSVIVGLLKPS